MNNENRYIWEQIKRGFFPQIELINQPIFRHETYDYMGKISSSLTHKTKTQELTLEQLLTGSPYCKIYIYPKSNETPYWESERTTYDPINFKPIDFKELNLRVGIIPLDNNQQKIQGYVHYEPNIIIEQPKNKRKYLLLLN